MLVPCRTSHVQQYGKHTGGPVPPLKHVFRSPMYISRTCDFNGLESMHHKHFLTYIPPPTHIFDVPKVVETFHITMHVHMPGYPPRPSSDANHNNLLLVDTLHLLLTPRLVDIFHNNLFLLLVDTFRVPMVWNTLHIHIDTLHLVQVPMVMDNYL